MLLSYLKLSLRLMARNPFFTFINLLGLAIGMTSFYILWEYSISELKSDQYHRDSKRIARVGFDWEWTDNEGKSWDHAMTGSLKSSLAPRLKDDYPEVESYVRILEQSSFNSRMNNHGHRVSISTVTKNEDRVFKEERVSYADANLFEFFSIPLVYGDAGRVLREANQVVISQTVSTKYFGDVDPRGELLKLNDSITLKVTGVFADLPHNTHLNFDIVISNRALQTKWNTEFIGMEFAKTYIKLRREGAFGEFERKLNTQKQKYWGESLKSFQNVRIRMFVQPLKDIAFSQVLVSDSFPLKSKSFLFTLAFISISVLVLAWANYINLSIIHINKRLKEVATRKVSGAKTSDMVKQFIVESVVIVLLASALSCTLIQLVRHPVKLFFNLHVSEFSELTPTTIMAFGCTILFSILIFSLYPTLISLNYNPRSLFHMNKTTLGKRFLPSLLGIVQFTSAIVVIILGFVIGHQLSFVMHKGLGRDQKTLVVIESPIIKGENYAERIDLFKKQLLEMSTTRNVTGSTLVLGDLEGSIDFEIKRPGAELYYGVDRSGVDENYISTYGFKLLVGRNFVNDDRADALIINRLAAHRLGYENPADAIGARIEVNTSQPREWVGADVIGVIEDFRMTPCFVSNSSDDGRGLGRGMVFAYQDKFYKNLIAERVTMQITADKITATMIQTERIFTNIFPGNVFTWYFLNDHVNRVYHDEQFTRNQIALFTSLTILIAGIGLLGMISFKVDEKAKEIGIRKVLGAQLHQIAQLLLNTTVKQILIASAIGIPIAYYFAQQYLQKFSERIQLRWWHYSLPVMILILIMLGTVATIVLKAAKRNPVEALKYE
jgi:putative ABC transport system permease protein